MPENSKRIVIISAVHDFRMLRRGSIQALASALARMGHDVTFFSLRFSLLSLIKRDSRSFLWRKANRAETVDGVRCYLWFTLIHPFQSQSGFLEFLFRPYYALHKRLKDAFLDNSLCAADYIIIESGQGILFANRARRLNPGAKIIYRASDKLSTIGAAAVLQAELEKSADAFDWFCLLSAEMADDFAWVRERSFFVPLGMDPDDFLSAGPNPYVAPINAVSVGSMLFDEEFFQVAGKLFPDIQFHVIGSGATFDAPANVKLYDEMAFKATLPYIAFASVGIAPYRAAKGADYLATSSLKLKQYEHFGIPAVCPSFAVGRSPNRSGYEPGNATSIEQAIRAAISSRFVPVPPPLTWRDLAQRLLDPRLFADCDLGAALLSRAADAGPQFPPASAVTVSLVVCTVGDRRPQLSRLLQSLKLQEFRSFEIIIVDQNAPGYLDEVLDDSGAGLPLKHLKSARGLSVARNAGLVHATGSVVAFPDDDCWYLSETLKKAAAFFETNPAVDVLLGRTIDASGLPSLSPLRRESGSVSKDNVWTSGNSNTLFVRRSAIGDEIRFDEDIGVGAASRFQSGEETDFVLTLIASGARAIYMSDLKVFHDQVENVGARQRLKRSWRYAHGFGYVLKKHEFGAGYLAYRVTRSFLSAIWAAMRLQPVNALSRVLWGAGTVVGYAMADKVEAGYAAYAAP